MGIRDGKTVAVVKHPTCFICGSDGRADDDRKPFPHLTRGLAVIGPMSHHVCAGCTVELVCIWSRLAGYATKAESGDDTEPPPDPNPSIA